MKPLVAFVDDAGQEVDLFREVFGSDFELVTGRAAQGVLSRLAGKKPALIILDVYLPVHEFDLGVPPELAGQVLRLEPDQGKLGEAYNNLVRAQERFAALQRAREHGLAGGLQLAREFATQFPTVPIVGYSRKSTPLECLLYMAQVATAVDFVKKPHDPEGWDKTVEMTRREGPRLLKLFEHYIGKLPTVFEYRRRSANFLLLKLEMFQSRK